MAEKRETIHVAHYSICIPINDLKEIEPQDGHDILTTIDVEYPDLKNALYKAMNYHQAEKGCAIVMEVETVRLKQLQILEE
ncbi:MAG: hypothetical protein R2784_05235 [Saprospiraceae bacterium]